MRKISVCFFVLLLVGLTNLNAQKLVIYRDAVCNGQGLFLNVGYTFPYSSLRQDPIEVLPGQNSFGAVGGARSGFAVGLNYHYEFFNTALENFGLGVFASADFMYNDLKKEFKNAYKELSCMAPKYFNIPVLAGISWTTPWSFRDYFAIYVEYGIGADIFLKTKEGWNDNMLKYNPSTKFAMECGLGFLLLDGVRLSAHYCWLGNHDVMINYGGGTTEVVDDRPQKSWNVCAKEVGDDKPLDGSDLLVNNNKMKCGMWSLELSIRLFHHE